MKTPFDTIYYTYLHLDAQKRPLYVGCGKGRRPYTRARNAAWRARTNNGQDFEVVIVGEFFNKSDAHRDERWLIESLMALKSDLVNERMTGKRGVKSSEVNHPRFRAYSRMRAQAQYRAEPFKLTFEEYLDVWGDDVPNRTHVCMKRIDNNKPWTVGNVYIFKKGE